MAATDLGKTASQLPTFGNVHSFSYLSPWTVSIASYVAGIGLSGLLGRLGFAVDSGKCCTTIQLLVFISMPPLWSFCRATYLVADKYWSARFLPVTEYYTMVYALWRLAYFVLVSTCLRHVSVVPSLVLRLTGHSGWKAILLVLIPVVRGSDQAMRSIRGLCNVSFQDAIFWGIPLFSPLEIAFLKEEDYFTIFSNAVFNVLDWLFWPFGKLIALVSRTERLQTFDIAETGAESYIYQPLDPELKEIRLLQLERSFRGSVHCQLIRVRLQFAPPFEAISYTWDGQERDNDLWVDGKRLLVTRNAIAIVKDRATRFKPRFVWIDGICINQDDIIEKSAQVTMMGEIYSSARYVLVWLENRQVTRWRALLALCLLVIASRRCVDPAATDDEKRKKLGTASMWRALETMFTHQYWNRIWVMQELANSKEAYIKWGCWHIPWEQLYSASTRGIGFNGFRAATTSSMIASKVNSQGVLHGTLQMERMQQCREAVKGLETMGLPNYLSNTLYFNSSDPRDQIYALYGMISSDGRNKAENIAPDYRTVGLDLYETVARQLLREDPDLLANRAGLGRGQRAMAQLPSWVPDWQQTRRETGSFLINYESSILGHLRYQAGFADIERRECVNYDFGPNCELYLEAMSIGTIEKFSSAPYPYDSFHELMSGTPNLRSKYLSTISQLREFHDSALALAYADPGPYLPTNQTKTEAVWRTIIGDRINIGLDEQAVPKPIVSDGFPAKNMQSVYENWRQWIEEIGVAAQDQKTMERLAKTWNMQEVEIFLIALDTARLEGRFAVTNNGLIAMVPLYAMEGDEIVVVPGLSKPVTLRKATSLEYPNSIVWQYVGECYVHGFMQGEALRQVRSRQRYVIV